MYTIINMINRMYVFILIIIYKTDVLKFIISIFNQSYPASNGGYLSVMLALKNSLSTFCDLAAINLASLSFL